MYIIRYREGNIAVASRAARDGGGWQEIKDDAPELLKFLRNNTLPEGYGLAGKIPDLSINRSESAHRALIERRAQRLSKSVSLVDQIKATKLLLSLSKD